MSNIPLSNCPFFDDAPDDELLTKLLSYPVFDNNREKIENSQNNEPNDYNQKPQYRKKIYHSPLISSFLKPQIISISKTFATFNYNDKCHCASRLYEVLINLEWPLEDFLSVLEEFYYDVDTREFEPISNVYEEIENKDVCFLEEYEREYKGLVLSNMERDFWESDIINAKQKKKKKKKKKINDWNVNITRKELDKLLKEREEICNNFNPEQCDEEVKFHFKKKGEEVNSNSKTYKLRERQETALKNNKEESFDLEYLKGCNQKIKMKLRKLCQEKEIKTLQIEKPIVLPEKLLLKKIEENLIIQNINQKKSFPTCFIEERSSPKIEEKETNAETVRLSSLGPKQHFGKKRRKEDRTPAKKKKNNDKKKRPNKKIKIEQNCDRQLRERRKPILKETINIDNSDDNQACKNLRTYINWEIDYI